MTIASEFSKLKASKTLIRKVLQRKGTGLALSENYPNYYTYVRDMTDIKNPDEIGFIDYAEDRCYSLSLNVTKIRPFAFRQYTCLQQLYLSNSEVVVLENINAFYGIKPTVFVPESLVDSYKTATNWSKISDRIKPYSSLVSDNLYLMQHLDRVQQISWIQQKTVGELQKEFR